MSWDTVSAWHITGTQQILVYYYVLGSIILNMIITQKRQITLQIITVSYQKPDGITHGLM